MLSFPNCKINLGLKVISKGKDGFHNLATIFYPIPFTDAVEVMRKDDENSKQNAIVFSASGLLVEGEESNNLCVKAFHLLKNNFPQLPPIQLHLHKVIPMGAGLGGGSADGAFTLKLLNEKFHLNLSANQLISYSLQLGSDCPFFIINKPCLGISRGEVLQPLDLKLSGYQLILINPGLHVNTGWAFSQLNRKEQDDIDDGATKNMIEIIQQPIAAWRHQLINDFEVPVFGAYPLLQEIKGHLYQQGAAYASMTGSGSTIFGLFEIAQPIKLTLPSTYFYKVITL